MTIRRDIDLVQGVNGQVTGGHDSKGKMKARTPSSPQVDEVRPGKANPLSTKNVLANIRKRWNNSGTPVLVACPSPNVTSDTYGLTKILLRHCCNRILI
jgi:hypothetical protein